jgi:hypothetical protein
MKEWTRPKNGTRALEAVFAIGVPQQSAYQRKTLFENWRPHGVGAYGQLHAAGRHLHDVRAAGCVEHVRAVEEARKALTVLAVADEAEAAGGREFARNAAHAAASASEREIEGHACHIHAGDPVKKPRGKPRGFCLIIV